jgi:hypothetical protein
MFDIPNSGRQHHTSRASTTSSNAIPSIVINMPDMPAFHTHKGSSPVLGSDPMDYVAVPWPTLDELLKQAESTDRHRWDFSAFKEQLEAQQFYGPNDVAACSAEELFHFCKIPAGAGKHLIEQAKRMCKSVKDEVRAQKRQRVN